MIQVLPEQFEAYRDRTWRRSPERRVETAVDAEQMVDDLGFCSTLTDARRPGPSLYIAVCGRRDAFMPRNVQKDPESSLAWFIKDEMMRRGRSYLRQAQKGVYVHRGGSAYFNALWEYPEESELHP
jgi:hypothetical protein